MFAWLGSVSFHSPDGVFLIRCDAGFLLRPEFLLREFLCFVLLVRRIVDYQNVAMDLMLISF